VSPEGDVPLLQGREHALGDAFYVFEPHVDEFVRPNRTPRDVGAAQESLDASIGRIGRKIGHSRVIEIPLPDGIRVEPFPSVLDESGLGFPIGLRNAE